jgi:signal peptidase II
MRATAPEFVRHAAQAGGLALAVFALDQTTKAWVWWTLRPGGVRVLVPELLELRFHLNTGAAFGLGQSLARAWPFVALALGFALAAGVWGVLRHADLRVRTGAALIVGGTAGNIQDRLTRTMEVISSEVPGVIDFIVVRAGPWRWPAFNLADVAILAGLGLFAGDAWRRAQRRG